MASRNFSPKQALEKGVKDLYAKISVGTETAATASIATTVPIVLTSVALGPTRNTTTFTIQVLAAAANPTDTVLAGFTGTAAAITCTITPNDGTNNGAVAVDLTTAELVELINTGLVAGKTVTITDASALRNDQTATGGDATVLANGGEGDGDIGTFSGGLDAGLTLLSEEGVESIVQNGVGDYTLTLEDPYNELKSFKGMILKATAVDMRFQIYSETVNAVATKAIRFLSLTGATPTDIPDSTIVFLRMDLKNSHAI